MATTENGEREKKKKKKRAQTCNKTMGVGKRTEGERKRERLANYNIFHSFYIATKLPT